MIMPDYSLVPVDHQPDFDDYSIVPVDHDPFAADGPAQQARIQLAQAQPQGPPQQQPATGAGQPDAGAPAAGGGPSGTVGGGIGAPNPDQGAAKAAPFGGYSLVPVDYDPFAADGITQQAQIQQPPTPTQLAQPQPQTQPQQEPVSPASTGRRLATAPEDRVASLASSALAAPKVATFRAAMRGSVSRARIKHGRLLSRKCRTLVPNITRKRPRA